MSGGLLALKALEAFYASPDRAGAAIPISGPWTLAFSITLKEDEVEQDEDDDVEEEKDEKEEEEVDKENKEEGVTRTWRSWYGDSCHAISPSI